MVLKSEDWDIIDATNSSKWLAQLNSELDQTHPLYRKATKALARCYGRDDVLYLLEGGQCAIVHLTYSLSNADGWPRFVIFEKLEDAEEYIAAAEYYGVSYVE